MNRLTAGVLGIVLLGLVTGCGGGGAASDAAEGQAEQGFDKWATDRSLAFRNVDYEVVDDNDGFVTVRITAEFRESPDHPWLENEATVDVVQQGDAWQVVDEYRFSPTQRALATIGAVAGATGTAQTMARDAAEASLDATQTVQTGIARITATAQQESSHETATAQRASDDATATAVAESISSTATAVLAGQLNQTYGEMEFSGNAGNWGQAIALAQQILTQAPNFRDTSEKLDEYIAVVYEQAVNSYNTQDWRTAISLFSILTDAGIAYQDTYEKLGAARAALRNAPPGVYTMDRRIAQQSGFILTLKTIEVFGDGTMRAVVTYTRNSTSSSYVSCPSDGSAGGTSIRLTDGVLLIPTSNSCSAVAGSRIEFEPGESKDLWANFAKLPDATQPFTFSWYNWGTTEDIVLIQGLD